MTVHTSIVGYYGIHYRDDHKIEVPSTSLTPCRNLKKIAHTPGFLPMLLNKKLVHQHKLPSAVVWKPDESQPKTAATTR